MSHLEKAKNCYFELEVTFKIYLTSFEKLIIVQTNKQKHFIEKLIKIQLNQFFLIERRNFRNNSRH